MINYLPHYLRKDKVFQNVFTAEEAKLHEINQAINDLKLQLSIDTATWALDIYERELKIKTNLSKSFSERRSVIKSKFRGGGKIDHVQIKLVADSYTNGDVSVSFNGHIIIKFTSQFGAPPNLDDLKNALEDIKPAHLAIDYEFRYLLIRDIHNVMTISEVESLTLDKFAGGEF